jgi:hypothetical protein
MDGVVKFLQIVEADQTTSPIGETKIPLLLCQQQSTEKSEYPREQSIPTADSIKRKIFISYRRDDSAAWAGRL